MGPVSGRTIFVRNSLWTAREQPLRGPGVWCDWGISCYAFIRYHDFCHHPPNFGGGENVENRNIGNWNGDAANVDRNVCEYKFDFKNTMKIPPVCCSLNWELDLLSLTFTVSGKLNIFCKNSEASQLDVLVITLVHDDVIKWKKFPRYWPFVRGIHRSPVNSPHKGQWRGSLMFTLICARINGWVNNREAGDLRRYRTHYDVIVMWFHRELFPCLLCVAHFENLS